MNISLNSTPKGILETSHPGYTLITFEYRERPWGIQSRSKKMVICPIIGIQRDETEEVPLKLFENLKRKRIGFYSSVP